MTRDEIRTEIAEVIAEAMHDPDSECYVRVDDLTEVRVDGYLDLTPVADAILARWPHITGPEQVTTREELEALPVETVIRDRSGEVWEAWQDDEHNDRLRAELAASVRERDAQQVLLDQAHADVATHRATVARVRELVDGLNSRQWTPAHDALTTGMAEEMAAVIRAALDGPEA
ncbi:hypothetical protein ACFWQG_13150 [Rhodococcus sp. NPDC058532]|uniref:hypothetical protein n=1 Tax=Rhodococcus sp. NPDC058532 TaxID=3346540 RepID=UPI0036658459